MTEKIKSAGIDTGVLTVTTKAAGHKIIDGIRITVPQGKAYALLGEDGRAKRLLMRLAAARQKDITTVDDESRICGLPISNGAAYVFDTGRLFSFMTCREYLNYGCAGLKMTKQAREARVNSLLEITALSLKADTKINRLTDAEYLCLCAAFSMFNDPPLVIVNADTLPFSKINRESLEKLVFGLKLKNKAVLINLSDPRMCGACFDLLGIMSHGKLVLEGAPGELAPGDPKAYFIKGQGSVNELSEKFREISDKYDVKIKGVKKPTLVSVYNKAVNK